MLVVWEEAERLKNCEMGEDRKVIIYVWVRQMSQPLSSSLWQSWALIHLLADCKRGGKKKKKIAIIVHQVQLGAHESTRGRRLSYSSCIIVPYLPRRPARQL